MLDFALLVASLVVIGYSFYNTVRLLTDVKYKRVSKNWAYGYMVVSAFLLFTFFLMSIFLFVFFNSYFGTGLSSPDIFQSGMLFVGALLIMSLVKINSLASRRIKQTSIKLKEEFEELSKEKEELSKKVEKIGKELESEKKLARMALGWKERKAKLEKEKENE